MIELPKLPDTTPSQKPGEQPPGSTPDMVYQGVYTHERTPRQIIRQMLHAVDPLSAAVARLEADLHWHRYFYGGVPTAHNPLICGCWITGNHKPVRTGDEDRDS